MITTKRNKYPLPQSWVPEDETLVSLQRRNDQGRTTETTTTYFDDDDVIVAIVEHVSPSGEKSLKLVGSTVVVGFETAYQPVLVQLSYDNTLVVFPGMEMHMPDAPYVLYGINKDFPLNQYTGHATDVEWQYVGKGLIVKYVMHNIFALRYFDDRCFATIKAVRGPDLPTHWFVTPNQSGEVRTVLVFKDRLNVVSFSNGLFDAHTNANITFDVDDYPNGWLHEVREFEGGDIELLSVPQRGQQGYTQESYLIGPTGYTQRTVSTK